MQYYHYFVYNSIIKCFKTIINRVLIATPIEFFDKMLPIFKFFILSLQHISIQGLVDCWVGKIAPACAFKRTIFNKERQKYYFPQDKKKQIYTEAVHSRGNGYSLILDFLLVNLSLPPLGLFAEISLWDLIWFFTYLIQLVSFPLIYLDIHHFVI